MRKVKYVVADRVWCVKKSSFSSLHENYSIILIKKEIRDFLLRYFVEKLGLRLRTGFMLS